MCRVFNKAIECGPKSEALCLCYRIRSYYWSHVRVLERDCLEVEPINWLFRTFGEGD